MLSHHISRSVFVLFCLCRCVYVLCDCVCCVVCSWCVFEQPQSIRQAQHTQTSPLVIQDSDFAVLLWQRLRLCVPSLVRLFVCCVLFAWLFCLNVRVCRFTSILLPKIGNATASGLASEFKYTHTENTHENTTNTAANETSLLSFVCVVACADFSR